MEELGEDYENQDIENSESLYSHVSHHLEIECKKRWEIVDVGQLRSLLESVAHDRAGLGEKSLTGIFRGPSNKHQIVELLMNYSHAILDSVDDHQTMKYALSVLNHETEIFNKDTKSAQYFAFACATAMDDDELLGSAMAIDSMTYELQKYFGLDTNIGDSRRQEMANSEAYQNAIRREVDRLYRKMDHRELITKSELLNAYNQGKMNLSGRDSEESAERKSKLWPRTLLNESELLARYKRVMGDKVQIELARRGALQELGEDYAEGATVGFYVGEDIFVEATIPRNVSQNINEVLDVVGKDEYLDKAIENIRTGNRNTFYSRYALLSVPIEDSKVVVIVRDATFVDSQVHPINSLHMVGIPNPPVDREQLQIVNQDLAHDITMNNERTLNARGVRIMLDQQDLAELGYEHIEFRRDRFRGSIDVELCVHNEQYQITLDRNLNLDLEGKQIHSLALQENLHYLVLSALRPVLCEKIENENESDWGEETRTVITRMGHYRLLPSGQHFSDYAAANCQEYDGKDLRVRDFMKTEEQRRNGTSEEGIRHLTYVKPLESDVEEQLPPVELHLPRPIAFE